MVVFFTRVFLFKFADTYYIYQLNKLLCQSKYIKKRSSRLSITYSNEPTHLNLEFYSFRVYIFLRIVNTCFVYLFQIGKNKRLIVSCKVLTYPWQRDIYCTNVCHLFPFSREIHRAYVTLSYCQQINGFVVTLNLPLVHWPVPVVPLCTLTTHIA